MITGFVLVKIAPVGRIIPVYRSLKKTKGIVEMHETTGESDLVIKVVARDVEELREMVHQIRGKRGVHSLETIVSYHRIDLQSDLKRRIREPGARRGSLSKKPARQA